MKILIGFFFGLMVASALAQINFLDPTGATLNAGVDPSGKMAPIKVDVDGYVICSTK